MHWGWGYGAWGVIWMVLFWVIVAALIVFVVRVLTGSSGRGADSQSPPPRDRDAVDILEERFAKGEIDREEFQERKRVLEESKGKTSSE